MKRTKQNKTIKKPKQPNFWTRHQGIKKVVIVALVIFFVVVGIGIFDRARTLWRQVRLEPFYETSGLEKEGQLGEVVRQEPLKRQIDDGTAYRILYRTQQSNGTPTFASGMIFVPDGPAPEGGRPVVAWGHGTVGMGNQCAPSRSDNPLSAIEWISDAMKQGWVVVATDYAGLGTPGTLEYLIGNSEAYDVINSVRAAQFMKDVDVNNRYAVWGHSQGGHSALFTSALSTSYAPELELVGTAAVAPAAELGPLMSQQQTGLGAWVIGPEVMVAWPSVNPALNVDDVLTSSGKRSYKTIAEKCIQEAVVDGLAHRDMGQEFFSKDIMEIPNWAAEAAKQTAPVLAPNQPVLITESTTDTVVLPNTTALYIQRACQAGSNLTSLWLSNLNHIQVASASAANTIDWIAARFANQPNISNCDEPAPVAPYGS